MGHPKATVTSASVDSPGTAPVSASTPDGMSRARTGASDRLRARMARAWRLRGSPVIPVPRIPSTRTEAPRRRRSRAASKSSASPSSSWSRRMVIPQPCRRGSSSGRSAARTAVTGRPQEARVRRRTSASPPLFPLPTKPTTSPRGKSRWRTAAAPRPAFSMRVGWGTPTFSMAQRSKVAASSPVGAPSLAGPKGRRGGGGSDTASGGRGGGWSTCSSGRWCGRS